MRLISRLYKIIRSNIQSPGDQQKTDHFNDHDFFEQQTNRSSQSTHERKTDRDPELATYYANLEVPYGSDLETIRQARNRLIKKYHPDLHSSDPEKQRIANELVTGINHAYTQLKAEIEKNAR